MTSRQSRVLRGGGWNYFIDDSRSAIRVGDAPGYFSDFSGFRIVIKEK